MKESLFICLLLIGMSTLCSAQNFLKMLQNQDYEALENNMEAIVALSIDSNQEKMSRASTIRALKTFFSEFRPVLWEELHVGSTFSRDSKYVVTNIENGSGEIYRLSIILKPHNETKKIASIRLRKNSD